MDTQTQNITGLPTESSLLASADVQSATTYPMPQRKRLRDREMNPEFAKLPAIAGRIMKKHGLSENEFHSPKRTRKYSWARQEFCHAAHQETKIGFCLIGKYLGQNHKTVYRAVKRHRARLGAQSCL